MPEIWSAKITNLFMKITIYQLGQCSVLGVVFFGVEIGGKEADFPYE